LEKIFWDNFTDLLCFIVYQTGYSLILHGFCLRRTSDRLVEKGQGEVKNFLLLLSRNEVIQSVTKTCGTQMPLENFTPEGLFVWAFRIIITGKPPALPGDSQSLTVPGIRSLHRLNRSKLKQTEASCDRLRKSKPLRVGLQVPCGLDTQVPKKGVIWPTACAYGGNIAGVGPTEGA